MAYFSMIQTSPLSCIGPGLYNWEDGEEFIQWLKSHPTFSADEVMHVNFIDDFFTWQNNIVDINLDILVDDIKLEDVVGMNFDDIQVQKLNNLIKKRPSYSILTI